MKSTHLMVVGGLAILAGIVALAFPLPASLTVNALVGAALVVAGIAGALGALRLAEGSDRLWGALLGLLVLVLGGIMLLYPVAGLQTLTMVFAIGFLASGIFKLMLGWRLSVPAWKWSLVIGGAISILLAVMIVTGLPSSAIVVPGILLAIELLTYGWGLFFLGLAWKERGL
ncbi:HdeD family acid-resistance protein [Neotabrizicola sp. sgz301269]|uniref:HdeD family acid-resistance protein n=1 Tax=Neotabrizicola sp. sgz301269 TaxID=3276282 RepID=UPI003770195F